MAGSTQLGSPLTVFDASLLTNPALVGVPRGTLPGGYAQVLAGQGAFTAMTDLTGLSVPVTLVAGRRVKITGVVNAQSSVADDVVGFFLRDAANTVWQTDYTGLPTAGNGYSFTLIFPFVVGAANSPLAGAQTFKLSMQRAAGTGNITTNGGANTLVNFILVEDIGV